MRKGLGVFGIQNRNAEGQNVGDFTKRLDILLKREVHRVIFSKSS